MLQNPLVGICVGGICICVALLARALMQACGGVETANLSGSLLLLAAVVMLATVYYSGMFVGVVIVVVELARIGWRFGWRFGRKLYHLFVKKVVELAQATWRLVGKFYHWWTRRDLITIGIIIVIGGVGLTAAFTLPKRILLQATAEETPTRVAMAEPATPAAPPARVQVVAQPKPDDCPAGQKHDLLNGECAAVCEFGETHLALGEAVCGHRNMSVVTCGEGGNISSRSCSRRGLVCRNGQCQSNE